MKFQNGGVFFYTVLALLLASALGMGLSGIVLPSMTAGLDSARIHQADYAVQAVKNIVRGEAGTNGKNLWHALSSLKGKTLLLGNLSVTVEKISVSWNHTDYDGNIIQSSDGFTVPPLLDGDSIMVQSGNSWERGTYSAKQTPPATERGKGNIKIYTPSSFSAYQNIFFNPEYDFFVSGGKISSISLKNTDERSFTRLPFQYGLLRLIEKNGRESHSIVYAALDSRNAPSSLDVLSSSEPLPQENAVLMVDRHADMTLNIYFPDNISITRVLRFNAPVNLRDENNSGPSLIFNFFKEMMQFGNKELKDYAENENGEKTNNTMEKLLKTGNKTINSEDYGVNSKKSSDAKLIMDNLVKEYPDGAASSIFNNRSWKIVDNRNGSGKGYYDIFLAGCNIKSVYSDEKFDDDSYIRVWRLRYYEGLEYDITNKYEPDNYACIIEPVWVKVTRDAKNNYKYMDTGKDQVVTRVKEKYIGFNSYDNDKDIIDNILYNTLSNEYDIVDDYYTHKNCKNHFEYNNTMYKNVYDNIINNNIKYNTSFLVKNVGFAQKYETMIGSTVNKIGQNKQKQMRIYFANKNCSIPSAEYDGKENKRIRYVQGTWYIVSEGDLELNSVEPRELIGNIDMRKLYSLLPSSTIGIDSSKSVEPNAWIGIDYNTESLHTDGVSWKEYLGYD